ncbi:MAG: hypothetical protein KDC44_18485, partial [Phaeodactylibacter sp.]|nr:hypothetical protein [Phaeodactylibacter sp.]
TKVNPFPAFKKKAPIQWIVKIEMDEEGNGPFLEAYWDTAATRSTTEMEAFEGKRVEVTGLFHLEQPPQPGAPADAVAFGGACLVEVVEVGLLDGE